MTTEQQERIESIIAKAEAEVSEVMGIKCSLICKFGNIRVYGVDREVILETVSKYSGFTKEDILGKSRRRPISEARMLCMDILRRKGKMTLKEIGEYLGGRDHSTVLHGMRTIEDVLPYNWELKIMKENVLRELSFSK